MVRSFFKRMAMKFCLKRQSNNVCKYISSAYSKNSYQIAPIWNLGEEEVSWLLEGSLKLQVKGHFMGGSWMAFMFMLSLGGHWAGRNLYPCCIHIMILNINVIVSWFPQQVIQYFEMKVNCLVFKFETRIIYLVWRAFYLTKKSLHKQIFPIYKIFELFY